MLKYLKYQPMPQADIATLAHCTIIIGTNNGEHEQTSAGAQHYKAAIPWAAGQAQS
jgi:hypothetical protein